MTFEKRDNLPLFFPTDGVLDWVNTLFCPRHDAQGDMKSMFCPQADLCQLPKIVVAADKQFEAREKMEIAMIDLEWRCLDNKTPLLNPAPPQFYFD